MIERKNFQPDIEQLKNLILSNEEYVNQPFSKQETVLTHVFELNKANKKLTYFGSPHIAGSESPIFDEIKNAFDQARPAVVYVEGMEFINQDKEKVREKGMNMTIKEGRERGEGAYALKLAIDAGADFECPEPAFSDEINALVENGLFSRKEIFDYYAYRAINQYQRVHEIKNTEDCKKYIRGHIDDFAKASAWPVEETERYEKDVIEELDIANEDFYADHVDPVPWPDNSQSKVNEVARASNMFRDRCIFGQIAEGLKKYDHVFVVYGAAHAVKEEPAFRALFDSPVLG